MSCLSLEDVTIRLGHDVLIPKMTQTINPGQILTVMGASGSGKSTLLSFISGTLNGNFKAQGRVILDGEDITSLAPERRHIGILYQDDLLFPHLSVGENLAFGLTRSVTGRQARRDRINQALAEAELKGFADRDPATLSGGQRSRVALLRTLLSQPKVLLLDEPFAQLDMELRDRFRRFVFEQASRLGLPTLLVTHDALDSQVTRGSIVHLGVLPE